MGGGSGAGVPDAYNTGGGRPLYVGAVVGGVDKGGPPPPPIGGGRPSPPRPATTATAVTAKRESQPAETRLPARGDNALNRQMSVRGGVARVGTPCSQPSANSPRSESGACV